MSLLFMSFRTDSMLDTILWHKYTKTKINCPPPIVLQISWFTIYDWVSLEEGGHFLVVSVYKEKQFLYI